jgi:acyl-CoA dehydrogenase
MLRALHLLEQGEDATDELAIAKFWASEGGARVTYAAQHLHGGIGVDVDYPVHRYYLWARQIGLQLGTGSAQLARIGERLAAGA